MKLLSMEIFFCMCMYQCDGKINVKLWVMTLHPYLYVKACVIEMICDSYVGV